MIHSRYSSDNGFVLKIDYKDMDGFQCNIYREEDTWVPFYGTQGDVSFSRKISNFIHISIDCSLINWSFMQDEHLFKILNNKGEVEFCSIVVFNSCNEALTSINKDLVWKV